MARELNARFPNTLGEILEFWWSRCHESVEGVSPIGCLRSTIEIKVAIVHEFLGCVSCVVLFLDFVFLIIEALNTTKHVLQEGGWDAMVEDLEESIVL